MPTQNLFHFVQDYEVIISQVIGKNSYILYIGKHTIYLPLGST